jgi:hypothetical protein
MLREPVVVHIDEMELEDEQLTGVFRDEVLGEMEKIFVVAFGFDAQSLDHNSDHIPGWPVWREIGYRRWVAGEE